MKDYLKFIMGVLCICLLLIQLTIVGIICFPQNTFEGSYQSMLQIKYNVLRTTDEPKIIVISGSSSAFGLDQNMLEEATGYKVANLGLQASIGPRFLCELSKSNINEGDIVLFAYEYKWWEDWEYFDSISPDLIMSGIDNEYEMYKYIPIDKWPECLGYLFTYANKKNTYTGSSGIYSAESFDLTNGQMIADRTDITYVYNPQTEPPYSAKGVEIDEQSVEYLKKFKEYVETQGASIYFTSPPMVDKSIDGDLEDFEALKEQEEEKIGIEYISNPKDYFFPEDYMYNGFCHCNRRGEIARTEQLIEDLVNAGIVNKRK